MNDETDVNAPNFQPPGGISPADKAVANQAYMKALEGKPLTNAEQTALKRYEKAKEEQLRWRYYASIPQKHWREMSGRQTKVLHDQQENYGLPIGGPFINLPEFVRKFHDFLAANARVLSKVRDGSTVDGTKSPALERYREERARLVRLDRLEREAELLPRAYVQEGLGRVATLLRGVGESLQRHYGPDALRLLDEGLDEAELEIERYFGEALATAAQESQDEPDGAESDCPEEVTDADAAAPDS